MKELIQMLKRHQEGEAQPKGVNIDLKNSMMETLELYKEYIISKLTIDEQKDYSDYCNDVRQELMVKPMDLEDWREASKK